MTKLDPLDAYKMYLAIKQHFTRESYDYFKYSGKVSASKESFLARRDKNVFFKISHTYSEEEFLLVLVSNFLADSSIWAGDLASKDGHRHYETQKKILGSMAYTFKEDLARLFDSVEKVSDLFKIVDGQNPPILDAFYNSEISIETFIILNEIYPFFSTFDEKLTDDIMWPKERLRCSKYRPFLSFDKQEFSSILKKIVLDKEP